MQKRIQNRFTKSFQIGKSSFYKWKNKGRQEVMLMTGGTDLLVKVLAADVKELNEIVTKKMRKVAGVDKTQTSIVLQEV